MVRRVEAVNDILHLKLANKGVIFPKFEITKNKTIIYDLPSEEDIKLVLDKAKCEAIDDAKKFQMEINPSIFDNYRMCAFDSCDNGGEEFEDEELDEDAIVEVEDDGCFQEETVIPEIDDENETSNNCEDKRFLEIPCPNGKTKRVRKSTLIWQYSENTTKISKDRLKRVQVSNTVDTDVAFHAHKIRRQSIN